MAYDTLMEPVESVRIAFIQSADPDAIAENLVAFANTEGGAIVVGVNADGSPAEEVPARDKIERALGLADNLYNPPVVIDGCDAIQLKTAVRPDATV